MVVALRVVWTLEFLVCGHPSLNDALGIGSARAIREK
jgi:hypothetical protein